MKKITSIILCSVMVLAFAGCGNESGGQSAAATTQTAGVQEVLEEGMEAADGSSSAESSAAQSSTSESSAEENSTDERQSGVDENAHKPEEDVSESELAAKSEGVDLDLTTLSSTMVYSEVYNMLCNPEEYMGMTVKMDGLFNYFHDQPTDKYYFACIIQDATACCSEGIEFILAGSHIFPDDYPEVGKMISVVGTFDTYMEGENQYCTLRDSVMEVL